MSLLTVAVIIHSIVGSVKLNRTRPTTLVYLTFTIFLEIYLNNLFGVTIHPAKQPKAYYRVSLKGLPRKWLLNRGLSGIDYKRWIGQVGLCDLRFFIRYKRPDSVRLGAANPYLAATRGSPRQEYQKEWNK